MAEDSSRGLSALALVPATVRHLHPEESVWEAMLAGWAAQMRSRALSVSTVEPRVSSVRRFMLFAGEYPWQWSPEDVDAWSTDLLGRRLARSTLRGYQANRSGQAATRDRRPFTARAASLTALGRARPALRCAFGAGPG